MTKFQPSFLSLLPSLRVCLTAPSLLASVALVAINAQAGEMYIYKDQSGQVLLTNVSPTGNFEKFTKKVKVSYYPDSKIFNGANTSYGTSDASNSVGRNAYDALIVASATRHGVDPALIKAMMHTESAFNPNARSPVGAQGLMQLMPATARRFSVNNPWNPAENIEGSARYIAWLMRRFNNNLEYVLAGYNAGEGNVDKYGGIPPFRETRNYVQKVMSRYHTLYKNDAGLRAGSSAALNNNGNYDVQPVSYATINNSASVFNALR